MLEVIFHQSLSVGHDPRRRGAPLGAAPVPARLLLVLVEQATRAAAAEEHEDEEDEHHGGQDDADNAADAGITKEICRQLVTEPIFFEAIYLSPILLTPCSI